MTDAWDPRWIWFQRSERTNSWGDPADHPRDSFGLLRRSFTIDRAPVSAEVAVVADSRYVLWVNGLEVGRGPARSDPALPLYDSINVNAFLAQGENVIAALVRFYGRPTTTWLPTEPSGELGRGSFALELRCDGDVALVSDDTWKAHPAWIDSVEPSAASGVFVPPGTEGPPPIEIANLHRLPPGWTAPGFDDSSWSQAAELRGAGMGPRAPLRSRPTAPLLDRDTGIPVVCARGTAHATRAAAHPLEEIARDGNGAPATMHDRINAGEWVTYDFGRIVCAHPSLTVDTDEPAVIDLCCGEDLDNNGRPVTAPREWAMRILAPGDQRATAESFEPVGFRYLRAAVRSGGASRIELRARERIAPRTNGAGFECSDNSLNHIWEYSLRTLDVCSHDAFVDCPGREQRAWLGDSYLSSLLSLVVNTDATLPSWNLRLHAQRPRPDGLLPMVAAGDFARRRETIPDHSLLWILGLAELYERTGDSGIVEELFPVAERILAFFERFRADDGLLHDVPWWVFIDWAQTARGSCIAALDALYAWTLERFAMLASVIGNDGASSRARNRATRTRDAFNVYFDRQRNAYVDALGSNRMSQHTNSLAILAGCAPRERWERMLERMLDATRLRRTLTPGDPGSFADRMTRQWHDPPGFDDAEHVVLAQPFFSHFVHRSVAQAGRADLIPTLLRRWSPMVERGNGCLEEYWTAEPGLGSRAHAWSGTALYDAATHILGARPSTPGMHEIVVDPCLGDLQWARGTIATPHGFVRIHCERNRDPVVEVPPGVEANVRKQSGTAHTIDVSTKGASR